MRMSIGENIQTLINRWYAYGALMRAQHNNTKTNVRSLPYRVALRCEMGFFGFQQGMGRGSKWDMRGTQWYKVDVEGRGTRFTQYKGRTRLWEAYKVTGKWNVGKKAASYYARSIHIREILLHQEWKANAPMCSLPFKVGWRLHHMLINFQELYRWHWV